MADIYTVKAILESDVSNFISGFKQAEEAIGTFRVSTTKTEAIGSTLKNVGKGMTLGVTAPLAAIGVNSIKTAASFEQSMSKVQGISKASSSDMQLLKKSAMDLGAKTKYSARECAEAFTYTAMAGWDAQKSIAAMPGIVNLAAASGEELATTSDIVTDSISAFGLQASDSVHYVDVLAQAATSSNTDVGKMGETFKYVAPLAGALGYSAEDTAVAIGIMANAGVKSSQAGTSLRTAFARLAAPTKEVKQGMEMIGLSMEEIQGIPLDQVLQKMRGGFAGLNSTQKVAAASMIFGKNAMSGMLNVMNASDADYNKLKENIYNCDGAAQQMADTMLNNLPGSITILQSALEGAAISIGELFQEDLKNAVDWITKLVDKFNGLDDGTKKAIVTFGLFAAGIGPALLVIGTMIEKFSKMKSTVQTLWGAFSKLKGTIPYIKVIFESLGKTLLDIGKAFLGIGKFLVANPWILVAAAAVAAAIAIYKNWDTIKEFFSKVWDGIKEKCSAAWESISSTVSEKAAAVKEAISTKWEEMKTRASEIWESIKTAVSEKITAMKTAVSEKAAAIKEAIANKWNEIKSKTTEIWESVKSTISEKVEAMKTSLVEKVTAIKTAVETKWNEIKTAATQKWQEITTAIKTKITEAVTTVQTKIAEMKSKVTEGFSAIVSGAKAKMTAVVVAVKEGWNNAVNAARNFISKAVEVGKNIIGGFVSGVKAAASNLVNAVKGTVKNAIDGAKKTLGIHSPSRVFRGIGDNTMKGFVLGIEASGKGAIASVSDIMKNISNQEAFFEPLESLRNIRADISSQMMGKIEDNRNEVKQPIEIALKLGNRSYRAFVNDISNMQGMEAELIEQYGF